MLSRILVSSSSFLKNLEGNNLLTLLRAGRTSIKYKLGYLREELQNVTLDLYRYSR